MSHAARKPAAAPRGGRGLAWLLAVGCLLATGCGETLGTHYGSRSGLLSESVNGTSVFSEMCKRRGNSVRTWRYLSPWLNEKADVIVWFPDDFEPPTDEVREWLDDWLDFDYARTLIYVGRDFDAAPGYWEKHAASADPKAAHQWQKELTTARATHSGRRLRSQLEIDAGWFRLDPSGQRRDVRSLAGREDWLDGVDGAQLEMELSTRLLPADGAEVWLECDGDALVTSEPLEFGQRIVIANGSFLLNRPLVNDEHRKLAARLLDEIGTGRSVVFLESRAGGPPIREKDPDQDGIGLQLFGRPPFNWLLLHIAALATFYSFWRFPIFGAPRQAAPASLTDFGRHVEAVGHLLERSGDVQYATQRIAQYRQTTHSETQAAARPPVHAAVSSPDRRPLGAGSDTSTAGQ